MAVIVPTMLRTRPREGRGYPIPFIAAVSRSGVPQFSVNDYDKVLQCVSRKLCGLCGRRLMNGVWFVGGRRCFTDPNGAFLDPPMHEDCARYAVQTCPYLAAPSYAGRIDDRKIRGDEPVGAVIVRDNAMPDERPDVFGLGWTRGYETHQRQPGMLIFRALGWRTVEWWRQGQQIEQENTP